MCQYCQRERANSGCQVYQQGWYKSQQEPEDNIFQSCKHQLDANTESAKQMLGLKYIVSHSMSHIIEISNQILSDQIVFLYSFAAYA